MPYGIVIKYMADNIVDGEPKHRCEMEAIGGDCLSVTDMIQFAYDIVAVTIRTAGQAPTPKAKEMLSSLRHHIGEVGEYLVNDLQVPSTLEYGPTAADAQTDSVN